MCTVCGINVLTATFAIRLTSPLRRVTCQKAMDLVPSSCARSILEQRYVNQKSAFVPIASAAAWTNGPLSPTSILNAQHAWAQNRADLERGCTRTLDDNLFLRPMNRETLMEFRHDSGDETGHAG